MTGHLLIAWQTVSRQRLRTTLSAISLILGVMTLTSVAAAEEVVQRAISRTALLTGGPAMTSSVSITTEIAPDAAAIRWAEVFSKRFGPSTRTARAVSSDKLAFSANGTAVPDAQLTLVDPKLIQIRPFEIIDGTWFDGAPTTLSPNVVLNRSAAARFAVADHLMLRWGQDRAAVTAVNVGTIDDGQVAPAIYVDLTQPGAWRDVALADGRVSLFVHAQGVGQETITATVKQVERIAGLTGETGDINRTDTVDQLASERSATTRVFVAIAVIALTIAALGMLNIGLSTVVERSDELALRRAFGAHRRDIVTIMLLESQLLAVAAGILGLAASYLCMPLTLGLLGSSVTTAEFPIGAALMGGAAGCFAALIGALTPAIRAARVPIASIMRG